MMVIDACNSRQSMSFRYYLIQILRLGCFPSEVHVDVRVRGHRTRSRVICWAKDQDSVFI